MPGLNAKAGFLIVRQRRRDFGSDEIMAKLKIGKLSKALSVFAVFVLALSSAGCRNPVNNDEPPPVFVTSAEVVPDPESHDTVVAGVAGTLRYLITIVGENVFPVDLLGEYVAIMLENGEPLPEGISVYTGASLVETSGESYPFVFLVNIPYDAVYSLVVNVRGVYSAPFELRVKTAPPAVESVTVVPAPDHGTVAAGEPGTLYYLITIAGENVFPVDLLGGNVAITLEGGEPLPEGISVHGGAAETSGGHYPFVFSVYRPAQATYSLVVNVRGVYSDPFYLTIGPPVLRGTVAISGAAITGQILEAVPAGLLNTEDLSFMWQRALYGTDDFADIPGEIASTYFVSEADIGYKIRVIVSRAGFTGTLISDPVGPATLPALTGTVTITGHPVVGQRLTANIADLHGTGTPSFQWARGHYPDLYPIPDASGSFYVLRDDDWGQTISVVVSRSGFLGGVIGGPTAPIAQTSLVAAQLAALHDGELPSAVTILTMTADEWIVPQSLYFGGNEIAITITSGTPGDTLYLDGNNALFTVGRGVTLILENITLWGSFSNTASTVVVESGARVYIRNGARLIWNGTDNEAFGGGVTVQAGGTLVMTGGVIEENIAINGGGVHNRGGTFIMRGGQIRVNDGMLGAGVFNSGRFELWGGTVAYNIAARGGGVANQADGTFRMFGGLIAANMTRDASAGVLNAGDFYLHGGQINHNFTTGDVGGIGNEGRTIITNGVLWNNRDRFCHAYEGRPGSGAGNLFAFSGTVNAARLGFYTTDPNDSRGSGWTRTSGPVPVFRGGQHDGTEFRTIYFFAAPAPTYPFRPEQVPVSIGIPRIEIRNGNVPEIVMDTSVRLLDIQRSGLFIGTVFPRTLATFSSGTVAAAHVIRHGTYVILNAGAQAPPLLLTLNAPPLLQGNVPWPWTAP